MATPFATVVLATSAITSTKLEKLVEEVGAKIKFVYLEDVRASVGLRDKLNNWSAELPPEEPAA